MLVSSERIGSLRLIYWERELPTDERERERELLLILESLSFLAVYLAIHSFAGERRFERARRKKENEGEKREGK